MKREHTIQGGLPSEYRQLEYIQSTGTQCIITNLSLAGHNNNVRWDIDFQFSVSESGMIIDCSGLTDNYVYVCIYGNAPNRYSMNTYRTAAGERYITIDSITNRHVYSIDFSTAKAYCDGNHTADLLLDSSLNVLTAPIAIFARVWFGNQQHKSKGKLRTSKITIEGVEHYLIPALRISDSKPGLFDNVDNVFYTNAGTEEFQYA